MPDPIELFPGILLYTSSYPAACRLNSAVVFGRGEPEGGPALLLDPGYLPGEIDAIASGLDARGAVAGQVLLTHSHWDHVAGARRFPEASLIASAPFAREAARNGEDLTEEIARRGSLVGAESELLGAPRPARAFPAPGHTSDSLALFLPEEGILFPGDYLSSIEIPYADFSIAEYRDTLAHFRRLMAMGRVRTVVPCHGPFHIAAEALRILEEDDDYLIALQSTARGGGPGEDAMRETALAARIAVPRTGSDPNVREGHARNAARAIAELGARTG